VVSDLGQICHRIPRVVSPSSPACTGTSLRIQTIGLQRATFSVEPSGRQPRYILSRKGRTKEVSVLRKPPAIPHPTCPSTRRGSGSPTLDQRRCLAAYLRIVTATLRRIRVISDKDSLEKEREREKVNRNRGRTSADP